jgi:hypothetical protein
MIWLRFIPLLQNSPSWQMNLTAVRFSMPRCIDLPGFASVHPSRFGARKRESSFSLRQLGLKKSTTFGCPGRAKRLSARVQGLEMGLLPRKNCFSRHVSRETEQRVEKVILNF